MLKMVLFMSLSLHYTLTSICIMSDRIKVSISIDINRARSEVSDVSRAFKCTDR